MSSKSDFEPESYAQKDPNKKASRVLDNSFTNNGADVKDMFLENGTG